MSNQNRPFEIGDLVVVQISEKQKPFLAVITALSSRTITINDEWDLHESSIKAIRKPRKGSQEARDIVAMLAFSYWKSLKSLSKGWLFGVEEEKHKEAMKDWWNRRKRKDEFILRSSVYFEFQKAKSMLK